MTSDEPWDVEQAIDDLRRLAKTFLWPVCKRCDAPVDRVTRRSDPFLNTEVFVVHCHGAQEETRLSMMDLMAMDRKTLERMFDEAFAGESGVVGK